MKKTSKQTPTTDAVEIIHRRYYEGRPQRIAELAEEIIVRVGGESLAVVGAARVADSQVRQELDVLEVIVVDDDFTDV